MTNWQNDASLIDALADEIIEDLLSKNAGAAAAQMGPQSQSGSRKSFRPDGTLLNDIVDDVLEQLTVEATPSISASPRLRGRRVAKKNSLRQDIFPLPRASATGHGNFWRTEHEWPHEADFIEALHSRSQELRASFSTAISGEETIPACHNTNTPVPTTE